MTHFGKYAPAVFSAVLAFLGGFVCAPTSATAQDWAKAALDKSPRHGEFVTIHEPGGRNLQAWVVYPEVKGKAPVVVMIHEIFGLTDWAREMADETAAAGYIVVEPDLLSGYGPAASGATLAVPMPAGHAAHLLQTSAPASGSVRYPFPGGGCDPMTCLPQAPAGGGDMPMHQATGGALTPASPGGTAAFPDQSAVVKAVSSLPDAGVLTDLDAAADYGKHLPAANGKLFVAGFCWGGGKSFLLATHRRDLSAALVFYGPPPPPAAMQTINAPVYGFYAGNDARITATLDGTRADMKAAGKTFKPVVYDGAGHGFMRAGEAPDASPANTAARQAAFGRMLQLLKGAR